MALAVIAETTPESLAAGLLQRYGSREFVVNPATIAMDRGFRLFQAAFQKPIKVACSRQRGAIYLNEYDSIDEKRYALAHALGHCLLHFPKADAFICNRELFLDNGVRILEKQNSSLEAEANRFAMALLLPYQEVHREWMSADSMQQLAREFGVPEYVVKRRISEMRQVGFMM